MIKISLAGAAEAMGKKFGHYMNILCIKVNRYFIGNAITWKWLCRFNNFFSNVGDRNFLLRKGFYKIQNFFPSGYL